MYKNIKSIVSLSTAAALLLYSAIATITQHAETHTHSLSTSYTHTHTFSCAVTHTRCRHDGLIMSGPGTEPGAEPSTDTIVTAER